MSNPIKTRNPSTEGFPIDVKYISLLYRDRLRDSPPAPRGESCNLGDFSLSLYAIFDQFALFLSVWVSRLKVQCSITCIEMDLALQICSIRWTCNSQAGSGWHISQPRAHLLAHLRPPFDYVAPAAPCQLPSPHAFSHNVIAAMSFDLDFPPISIMVFKCKTFNVHVYDNELEPTRP